MTHEKVCVVCGKTFTAHRKDVIYCSNECRHKDYFKKHYHPRQPTEKTCAICGKPFSSKWPRACYCSDECRKEAARRHAAKQYAKGRSPSYSPEQRRQFIESCSESAKVAVAALTEYQRENLRLVLSGSKSAIVRHYLGGQR